MTHICRCKINDERCQNVAPEGYTCLRTRVEHVEGMDPDHSFTRAKYSALARDYDARPRVPDYGGGLPERT